MSWKIGEVIVGAVTCKGNTSPPVKKDYRYVIQNIYICPRCKLISFDVGFINSSGTLTRCGCKEGMAIAEIHWADSSLFKKLDLRSKEERIEEAIKNEDYELITQIQEEQ